MSLRRYLTRLIWFCILPLVGLAAILAGAQLVELHSQESAEAETLVHNIAASLDRDFATNIAALQLMASSPLVETPDRWHDLYLVAQGFQTNFGSHVILADLNKRMIFNTRSPFGTTLPNLPEVGPHAAAPVVLATGKPAVSDSFIGPVVNVPLVATAVPVTRNGQTTHLLLAITETAYFQKHLADFAIPPGWSVTVRDGVGKVIAASATARNGEAGAGTSGMGRYTAGSVYSPWSVELDIPTGISTRPIIVASLIFGFAIVVVTWTSLFGGKLASRHLADSMLALIDFAPGAFRSSGIAEIDSVYRSLDDAHRIRSRFLAHMSHELRTPLNAILGFSEAMRLGLYGELSDLQKGGLDSVSEAGSHLLAMVNDILDLSKAAAGKLEMNEKRFDLVGLAKQTVALVTAMAEGRGIDIIEDYRSGPALLMADERMVRQMLLNLLSNAIKFTGNGGTITVATDLRADGGLTLAVADTGQGIPHQHQQMVFEAFYQAHKEAMVALPGTGLGLPIVKSLIDLHGGTLSLESEEGRGTKVGLQFPPERTVAGEGLWPDSNG